MVQLKKVQNAKTRYITLDSWKYKILDAITKFNSIKSSLLNNIAVKGLMNLAFDHIFEFDSLKNFRLQALCDFVSWATP